jgi:hypothetical protein
MYNKENHKKSRYMSGKKCCLLQVTEFKWKRLCELSNTFVIDRIFFLEQNVVEKSFYLLNNALINDFYFRMPFCAGVNLSSTDLDYYQKTYFQKSWAWWLNHIGK